jgi:hypothetical protein
VVAALARRAPASAAQDELHFQQFLAANCFGDHVARAGIGVTARELGVLAQDVAAKIALLIFGVVLVVGFVPAQASCYVARSRPPRLHGGERHAGEADPVRRDMTGWRAATSTTTGGRTGLKRIPGPVRPSGPPRWPGPGGPYRVRRHATSRAGRVGSAAGPGHRPCCAGPSSWASTTLTPPSPTGTASPAS